MTDLRRRSKDLWLISAGMIFLFNPCINIIDVLPDVIGIALILFGIRKYADLSSELGEAKKGFGKAAWVSLAGFLQCYFRPRRTIIQSCHLRSRYGFWNVYLSFPPCRSSFPGLTICVSA